MIKLLFIFSFLLILQSLSFSQKKKTDQVNTNQKNIVNRQAVIIKKLPNCNGSDYFPLCSEMKYVYREVNALKLEYENTLHYKYFTTVVNNGQTFYGYVLNKKEGEGENFYYSMNGGFLNEHYEIPDVTEEYMGSAYQAPPLFAPIWHPGITTDYYETHVDYNSGNFRSIKLIATGDRLDSVWTQKAIVDRAPATIITKIIKRLPSYAAGEVIFHDLIILEQEVKSNNPLLGEKISIQEIVYAKGVGIIAIRDIGKRQHLLSDFVKPNRQLISYEASGHPRITINSEAYNQLFVDLIFDRNPDFKKSIDEAEKKQKEKFDIDESYKKTLVSMPTSIDQSLIGVWKLKRNDINAYIRFNSDGTNEYFSGDLTSKNLMLKNFWAVQANQVYELISLEWAKTKYKPTNLYEIKKRSIIKSMDSVTGERTINLTLVDGRGDMVRTYICTGNKMPW